MSKIHRITIVRSKIFMKLYMLIMSIQHAKYSKMLYNNVNAKAPRSICEKTPDIIILIMDMLIILINQIWIL